MFVVPARWLANVRVAGTARNESLLRSPFSPYDTLAIDSKIDSKSSHNPGGEPFVLPYIQNVLLRGTIVNRTYGVHKNLYI